MKLLLAVAKMLVDECSGCEGTGYRDTGIDRARPDGWVRLIEPCPRCKELREAIRESEA